MMGDSISTAAATRIERERARLDATATLIAALSPAATLARGYSITRYNGKAVTDATTLPPDATLTTILARGEIVSEVKEIRDTQP